VGVGLELLFAGLIAVQVKFRVLGTGKRSHKVTPFHELFLTVRAGKSLPCSVKAHVGMEPHAKTPPPPVLSPEVSATQALELVEFVVEPVSTPQPQPLNQNPSVV